MVDYIYLERKHHANLFTPLPIILYEGSGSDLYDIDGKKYIDFATSYGSVNLGHCHPKLVKTLKIQASTLAHSSRAYYNNVTPLFLTHLSQVTGFDQAIIMNSGAEAVETAIKAARRWGWQNKKYSKIIVARNNFHGRTTGIISFSSEDKYKRDFEPLMQGFLEVEFGNIDQLKQVLENETLGYAGQRLDHENIAAILLEPIQGEAGVYIPSYEYMKGVRELCDEYNILMILDEIQTGMGRTGKMWAWEHYDIKPDAMCIGKALGGGLLPISAFVANAKVMDVFTPGSHGSTFGGNPLACAVAKRTLEVYEEDKIVDGVDARSKILADYFSSMRHLPLVKEIRHLGMIAAIELKRDARDIVESISKKGVLCRETHSKTIRLAPALNIPFRTLIEGLEIIEQEIYANGH